MWPMSAVRHWRLKGSVISRGEDVANEHRRQGKTSEEQGLKYYNFSSAIRQSGGSAERFGVNADIFLL
jgi:hypothetical protein